MSTGLTARETRVLNPRPRRHHRPTYSLLEVRIGAGVVALLVAIAGGIAWMGARPDPELFAEVAAFELPAPPVERGALPSGLAADGWREGPLSRFQEKNLYEKINGRADFFTSRGFQSLTFASLSGAGGTVDVEFYDMGSAENALGAFSAERPPETRASMSDGTSFYVARNAMFLARGRHYVRLLGSDEGPAVRAQLDHVRRALEGGLAAGERPWSHALFADALGLLPDRIAYEKENAFSFGFAKDVHVGLLLDGETEAFVAPAADAAAARELAKRFEEGFLSYGERDTRAGVVWIKDRYLGSFTRVAVEGAMVVGVRGAARIEDAAATLEKLRSGVARLPASVASQAPAVVPSGRPAYE